MVSTTGAPLATHVPHLQSWAHAGGNATREAEMGDTAERWPAALCGAVGRSMAVLIILTTLLIISPAQAQTGHVPTWTDRYKSYEGVRCCNMECQPADVTIASSTRGEVWVNGMLLTLPLGSIHPMPADAEVPLAVSGYVCWRARPLWPSPESIRCVWYRSGAW